MFVGRETELDKLNKMYISEKFECAVIYGRRRVGKTALVREFIKDKKSVYFSGMETSEKNNLENFSASIFQHLTGLQGTSPVFGSFSDAFDYLADSASNDRLILVIDEYPYLASASKGISSVLQNHIDTQFLQSRLFIILCGSSMSFMENQVLGYASPLFGRRTAQFHLKPFSFFESKRFHHDFSDYDSAMVFGITGGIPKYLELFDDQLTIKENIMENFLNPSAYLYEEPANLLKQELREPQTYNTIISAIASGSSKLNEISTKTGISSPVCSKYLSSLISLGLIRKEKPIMDEKSKKTLYALEDHMFRFWYRFIPKNISRINEGYGGQVYTDIEKEFSNYMGKVFEEICKQYLWKIYPLGILPFEFKDVGRWWGNNPLLKREQEIDLIAYSTTQAIFAECKWRNERVDIDILDGLKEKSRMFPFDEKYYYLFSKSGFTDKLKKVAAGDSWIRLIDMEEICHMRDRLEG